MSDYSADYLSALREQQSFLDGAIHAVRAPLRGIGTSAALLAQRLNDRLDGAERELLRSIGDGVSSLNSLTRALADYSMSLLPATTMQRLPVENAVESALAQLRSRVEQSSARIHVGPLPRISANHEQLSVLFRNLLENALEHHGGTEPPRIEITATRAGDQWRFAISDNAVGVPGRFHRQIFEPFERLQSGSKGSGLGLAICRRIVNAHGGTIWVNSSEGDGSTFFFTLPADPAEGP